MMVRRFIGLAAYICMGESQALWLSLPRVGVSSKGIAVVLCVSVCENVFCSGCCYFSPCTRETPDFLSC